MVEKYFGNFNSWNDVKEGFEAYSQDDMKPPEEEPDVIYAEYDDGGYGGEAWVVYREDDKIYLVQGGHCSCYGLEDQWSPEEYTEETFIEMLDKAANTKYPYGIGLRAEAIKERLNG